MHFLLVLIICDRLIHSYLHRPVWFYNIEWLVSFGLGTKSNVRIYKTKFQVYLWHVHLVNHDFVLSTSLDQSTQIASKNDSVLFVLITKGERCLCENGQNDSFWLIVEHWRTSDKRRYFEVKYDFGGERTSVKKWVFAKSKYVSVAIT